MPFQLEFVEDFPQVVPDPPRAQVQFSVKSKCENTGDEDSPEAEVRTELFEANGNRKITSIGRNVVSLAPGDTDEDTVGIGAVGRGSGTITVTIGGVNGVVATIPITVI